LINRVRKSLTQIGWTIFTKLEGGCRELQFNQIIDSNTSYKLINCTIEKPMLSYQAPKVALATFTASWGLLSIFG